MVWFYTSNGKHSVRSAYHLSNSRSLRNDGESSHGTNQENLWSSIWILNVINGVKSFIWRACHESFPTCLNLQKRKLRVDSLSPICRLHDESIAHILWDCESAKDVRSQCHKLIQKISCPPWPSWTSGITYQIAWIRMR